MKAIDHQPDFAHAMKSMQPVSFRVEQTQWACAVQQMPKKQQMLQQYLLYFARLCCLSRLLRRIFSRSRCKRAGVRGRAKGHALKAGLQLNTLPCIASGTEVCHPTVAGFEMINIALAFSHNIIKQTYSILPQGCQRQDVAFGEVT